MTQKTLNNRVPIVICILVLTIYTMTLSPTINSFDSAEFITGAYTLGIIHAPGYPLYLMLGHVTTLIPFVSVPVAINFLSAFFATLCVLLVFRLSYSLTGSSVWSSASALLLAFSNLFWSRSLIAEVYPLNSFFIVLMVLFYTMALKSKSPKYLLAFSFVAGLSFTHHTSVILIVPWFFLSLLLRRKIRLSNIGLVVLLFVLPLSLYAYFPLRATANVSLNYVRDYFDFVDLRSYPGILWMISGKMFQQEIWGRTLWDTFSQLLGLLGDLWLNLFGAGFILALLGLWHYLKTKRIIAIPFLLSILSVLLFFSAYDVVDNREMIIPAMVLLAPFISVGGMQLQQNLKVTTIAPHWPLSFVIIVVGSMVAANWLSVDRHRDWTAYEYSKDVLAEVEPNSLIITQWTAATPIEYMLIVERRRPDVAVFDRGLFSLGNRAKFLACQKSANLTSCAYSPDNDLPAYINKQLPERPIYITEYDPIIKRDYCLVGTKNLYRVLPLRACSQRN